MKKSLAVFLAALCAVSLVACSSNAKGGGTSGTTSATQSTSSAKPLVGISLQQAPTGWVAAVQYYADKEAKALGMNYKITAASDANDQSSQIQDLINMKPKAIIVHPANDQVAVAAQKIKDAGIKLFVFDRTCDPTVPDYYYAGDNTGMGTAGADYIAKKLNNQGSVIVASVASWGTINTERIGGFKTEIAKVAPNIKILGTYDSANASPENGLKTMTDVLQAQKHIDGVYSVDDELNVGLYQAVTEAKRTDIKVFTGGGGAQSYFKVMAQTPTSSCWLSSALYAPSMITSVVKNCNTVLNGGTVAAKIIEPSKIVDQTNYKQYLDPKSPY